MDSDSDDAFEEDMEALKRACHLTHTDATTEHPIQPPSACEHGALIVSEEVEEDESAGEEENDIQLLQSIQNRFLFSAGLMEPFRRRASATSNSDCSDSDDDYETLMAIQRRFAAYDDGGLKSITADVLPGDVQVGAPILDSVKETSNSSVERSNAREGSVNCVDTCEPTPQKEAFDGATGSQQSDLVEWDRQAADTALIPYKHSHFPDSALIFFDAIKKNRSYQKLIRSKMIQMESRMEELRKLIERVKILKDFQVACKKRTARALSQKKDARMQLISKRKLAENIKFSDRRSPLIYKGPPENPHVANYRHVMMALGIDVCRKSWSKEERENLLKGVKQQFQGMLLQRSVDLLGEADGSDTTGDLDSVMLSIKDVDITPERIRSFLPKVNWEQLAAMYVPGRTGDECQARFLNYEDPLINQGLWTAMEDKNLLHTIQQRGLSNWIEIAASLGTNRTPFQCLARYQRSLNASILKREWTKEDDNQLRAAVENFGEGNWQLVASMVEGRTGTQCSNRWLKTLHPARQRVGKWTAEEDKQLKVAVTLFGPKTWRKVASCVPGRTHVQCRERWVNCLDPSLSVAEWNDEEDRKLEEAIAEHGFCWSKVAACIPHRTDNQCWRRWKVLYPDDVTRFQEARKIQKAALISNFVDRENERPALRPTDFIMPRTLAIRTKSAEPSQRKRRKPRSKEANDNIEKGDLSWTNCTDDVLMLTNRIEIENSSSRAVPIRRGRKRAGSKKGKINSSCNTPLPEIADRLESFADESNGLRKLQPRKKRSESAGQKMDPTTEPENDVGKNGLSSGNAPLINTQVAKQNVKRAEDAKNSTRARETPCSDGQLVYLDTDCSASANSTPGDVLMKDRDERGRSEASLAPDQHSREEQPATLKVPNGSTVLDGNNSAEGGDATLASFLLQSQNSKMVFYSRRKRKTNLGSCDQRHERWKTRDEVDVGDDATLSEFCNKIKKKRESPRLSSADIQF